MTLNLPDKKIATIFLDPIGDRRQKFGYDEKDVIDLILSCNNKDYYFIVKPHPRNDYKQIKKIIDDSKIDNIMVFDIKQDYDAFDLVNISDCVLGMTSIMLAHSLCLGKQTASIQINPTASGKNRSNPHYDKIILSDKKSLVNFLTTFQPEYRY